MRTDSAGLDENMAPVQHGCKIGDVLRSYSADIDSEEPLLIKHFAESGMTITCEVSGIKMYWDP